MSELDQDPSANTGRFRAFAEQVERESGGTSRPAPRGLLIGAGVALVVIIIVILAVAL
ncbi:MAG: hypothetical protein JO345_07720 [Streptosporangiaceae bacterium]|nr:hypothetical protein [Streptosporangiaceae bacterium]